jgi:hypothetical protein
LWQISLDIAMIDEPGSTTLSTVFLLLISINTVRVE